MVEVTPVLTNTLDLCSYSVYDGLNSLVLSHLRQGLLMGQPTLLVRATTSEHLTNALLDMWRVAAASECSVHVG